MKKKHTKILCAILAILVLTTLCFPAFADGEEATPTTETSETTPVIQSIDINANYYAGDTPNTYSIVFTAMDEIPAFNELTMKIKLEGATVDQAFFSEGILEGGVADVVRGSNYATYPLTYMVAKAIPEKTTLCTLVVTSATAPISENLSILDFSIIKENETEATPLSANITLAAGPIIPELNEETQEVYDALCALPNPATLSYYQEDGSFTNLAFILDKAEAAKTAYNSLPSAYRADLDIVMAYYNKANYATGALASMVQAMLDARGLIEIAKATESITAENALSYQFLVTVFDAKKNISLENILPDSTARSEISQILSAMQTAATTVDAAKAVANAETDGGCKTKTYACQTQLTIIQSLGGHKYHTDYMADLESQITALKADAEIAYASDTIMKKALLDTLTDVETSIDLIKEGVKDMPTVKIDGINIGNIYTVTFTRKSVLPGTINVSASFVVTDKNGVVIDTIEKPFPANSLTLDIALTAYTTKYTTNEYYTITAYYHVNDGKFLIDTQDILCYYRKVEEIGGLGNGSGSGLGGGTATAPVIPSTTPSTGGTIFPDSNDTPEIIEPEITEIFTDIENYDWAAEAINALYKEGIIDGMEDGIFNPSGQVTREQFCKMVVALFDIPLSSGKTTFLDVDSNAWYAPYVSAAVNAGYIQGESDEYFGTGKPIMRQDIAVILYRALGNQDCKVALNFVDKDQIAPYAEDAISELVGLGIINGYEDDTLKPRGTATRAEAAKIIYGVYQYLND